MVFSSLFFLSVFLPLFLGVYYMMPERWRSAFILFGSYCFYAWWRVDFTLLFAAVTFITYLISLRLAATGARGWLIAGLAFNLLTLAYFKYFNFGLEAWNTLTGSHWHGWKVVLPIGISFYIFHCLSYLIDVWRKDTPPASRYWDFAAFTALFPHLIAGPVLRYKDLAWQFAHRTHSWEKFNEGVLRFMIGFSKKVLIADTIAPLADMAFAQPHPTMAESWLGLLAYAAQLYFDFSGYSDMAVGLALMLGFRFIENFNHPYLSRSITEFWSRWHISLSTWLRDYLYIPLGGNRKGKLRTYINLLLTMLLGGLWHGASFTFLLWGAWHGALLAAERALGSKRQTPYPRLLAWPVTLLLVLFGWVLFRAADLDSALHYYAGMFGQYGTAVSSSLLWQITPLMLAGLMAAWVIIALAPRINIFRLQLLWPAVFALALCKLVSQAHTPFLYFQF